MTSHITPTPTLNALDEALLTRYLLGEASAEDETAVQDWLDSHPVHRQHLETMRTAWQVSAPSPTSGNPDDFLDRLRPHLEAVDRKPIATTRTSWSQKGNQRPQSFGRFRSPSIWKAIPIIGVMAVAVVAVRMGKLPWANTSTSETTTWRTHATTIGQRAKLQLPDGSTVLLGPASSIRYAADFGKTSRAITLSGQALFTVVRDGHPPFVVQALGSATRVLGTTFAVRAYADDPEVRVVVAEGKVELASRYVGSRAVLSSGEEGVAAESGTTVHPRVDVGAALAWTDGRLEFRNTPFRQVVMDVRRARGIELVLADSVAAAHPITASIGSMPVESLIALLADLSNTHAERKGSIIFFKER